ncbi:MAG TPA: PAS domain S-box protein [Desulfobacteraceae bacterium]|nr:PAS domain S-box protein [Desulfobacteraceae bacterium]HPJ68800.1 PAS domain S-box protein [Desulfobacteraceae bacterium]HPQ27637.1 PAS domain S-box protein [Desulfobacteraceae bacterium]
MKSDKQGMAKKSLTKSEPKDTTKIDSSISENILVSCEKISSERYQAFVENIEEGVYELDIHGNFLYFNSSLCRIFGRSREEIQFQNIAKFMDEEYARKGFKTFNEIYRTGHGVSDLIWKINVKDSSPRIIELSANLISNKEGEKIGFRGIARDISDKFNAQESLKKSERRYRTLLDFVPYPIAVFTREGKVSYLNPSFTETFGWSLEELEGKNIPYIPEDLVLETKRYIRRLLQEKIIRYHETQRLTKDGRRLDVVIRASVYSEAEEEQTGQLLIYRDITQEKRITRINEALRRISMALPNYPDLGDLLDFISWEVKPLLGVEGALVILLDEEKDEFYFKSGAHDDSAIEKRVKEVRFPSSRGVAGEVVRTGRSIIVPDTSKAPFFYSGVDTQAGFKTLNMLDVPLRSKDRIIGVLCVTNKKTGTFDQTDVELLNMVAGTVELSVENARFSKELQEAYEEVKSLNRAKDKVINRLSHELKTPLAVLSASLNILAKRLSSIPEEKWCPTIERAQRNLDRILEIQYQVEDIMRERQYDTHYILSWLVDECIDVLETILSEEVGEGPGIKKIRERIDEIFGSKENKPEHIFLDNFVKRSLKEIKEFYSHRNIEIITQLEAVPVISIPVDPLKKVFVGLIKNAIENTPDEGKIEITARKRGNGAELIVRDYGVGITSDNQKHIFEGFFATQETMDYSSKRPFDFNAGGKGADLLRMKIFSERYNFKIDMSSSRCRYIPHAKDSCPGRISHCEFCENNEDCYLSGGTTFTVYFPSVSETDNN